MNVCENESRERILNNMNIEIYKTIHRKNRLVKTFKGDVLFEKGRVNEQGSRIDKWTIYHDKTWEQAFYENGRLVRSTLFLKQKFWEKLLRPARVLKETFYDADGSTECQTAKHLFYNTEMSSSLFF